MERNDGGVRRRGRGALYGAAAGLVAVTAVTAAVVVAVGSSSGHADASAAATPPPAASPALPPVPSLSPSSEASAAASVTASAPAARVSGHVSDGVHTGDLRFFLLPAPADADVYGDRDGSPYTADDIAGSATDPADARAALTTYGFRSGAYRTYLTGDGAYEVSARLIRLGSPAEAAAYYRQHTYDGTRIPLDGAYPARAYDLASASAESTGAVVAVSYQGDVQITLTLTGGTTPSARYVRGLLDAQYQRLRTGR
ncbi:hypothetical protein ABZ901_03940 [Actinacidiphila alni]|uniref:hypothetical protein n=1 Tax=Actinacidiphila alni TaxID=380248 RepID=UPI0033DE3977